MATATSTAAYTRTHTATYLAEAIMGALGEILLGMGIDVTRFNARWEQNEKAITAWIAEASLEMVILECHRPDGTVTPVFEFPVTYENGDAEAPFVESRARLARYRAKVATVPAGTIYRLFVTYNGPHSAQAGWGPAKRASTEGLRSSSFGSLAEGPHARVALRHWS